MDNKQTFKPYISADKVMPEFSPTSIILGILLAVVFGAANAYLGLRVGMTVSASIPAAVISMGVLRVIMRRNSVLESNLVQTIGSAGESVAAGAIFTIPALFMWAQEWGEKMPSMIEITLIAFCGGALGVLFMVPLRKALIVKEHGTLPYPEGTACAEVLLAGEEGGAKASGVFVGLGIAALYKLVTDGIKVFPSEVHYEVTKMKGAGVGCDVLPALVGVGYICGPKISSYMLCGGILGWLVIMPLIYLFGNGAILFPAEVPIAELFAKGGSPAIWSNYIKYIGAGAVAAGGIMSLIKSLPLIVTTFGQAMKDYKSKTVGDSSVRTDRDMSMNVLLILIIALTLIVWLVPVIPVNIVGAIIIVIFGFFFATVSSRLVGLVGSSNNPVSGMAIATLLFSTMLLKATGMVGHEGMIGAIAIGSVICIIAAIAGDTSQDLKTGYILGATPVKQQYGELIGVVASALAIGGVLYLLNTAWGYGSQQLPAPQATLMKLIVEGVMGGNLPWVLVFAGVFIAIVVEILGIPVLPFAVGLYLPIHLSVGIMAGGLVRLYFEKKKNISEKKRKAAIDCGILYTSGMIAGEGLVGILLAVFAIIPLHAGMTLASGEKILSENFGQFIDISARGFSLGNIGAIIFFILLILTLFKASLWKKDLKE